MKKIAIIALLIFFVIGVLSLQTFAAQKGKQAQAAQQPTQDKLQRGGANLALGWTEIPKAVVQVTKDSDNPFLGITVGLLKGLANSFARTTSGAVDVVTFHNPSQGDSLLKPSMVEVSEETQTKKTK